MSTETTRPRRVLVTGSRNWVDPAPIYRALYFEKMAAGGDGDLIVVHGDCPTGADAIAARWVERFYPEHTHAEAHPADWDHFGKAAGPMRNQKMVDLGADVCLAFPLPGGKGTQDCMAKANLAGIPLRVFHGQLAPSEPPQVPA